MPPRSPTTLTARVRAAAAQHPNSSADELAAILGVHRDKVASTAHNAGVALRKLTPEEYRAAHTGRRKPPNYYRGG